MNTPRKIILTIYLAVWLYLLFFAHFTYKGDRGPTLLAYLILGWIPFLIAYFIWREKKENK